MSRADRYLYGTELVTGPAILENRASYGLFGNESSLFEDEMCLPIDLQDMGRVTEAFQSIDWAFTDADTTFLTHALHPYPAKFIPQIPEHCIRLLSTPGELVMDPFGGSGTTALESVRLGRRALSIDANPVGTLIGKVKSCNLDATTASDLRALQSLLATKVLDLPRSNDLCEEYRDWIPRIPNIDKWFPPTSRGELALIKSCISRVVSNTARDIAMLALSRIILNASFQDSETRYSSKPREITQGATIKNFLRTLTEIVQDILKTQAEIRYGVSEFVTADSRNLAGPRFPSESVDLIVTSPPYGNANDYHLYHRFRLLWLGYDPRDLGQMEIGSHLRHQREASGFDSYMLEMQQCINSLFRTLRTGRYAVMIVGDAIYNNVLYPVAERLSDVARDVGFETVCIVDRPVHATKRSFTPPGRRAVSERLLVLRKRAPRRLKAWFQPPPYRLWPYENEMRRREIESIIGSPKGATSAESSFEVDPYAVAHCRKLVFTHGLKVTKSHEEPTWQAILENGLAHQVSSRKDPKYATHGLHPYKGKFYPQLAKGLMNLCSLKSGSKIFDPFCGSGTTLLEGHLNGYETFGCDMNPLASKIAKAKVGILNVNPDIVREAVGALVSKIEHHPNNIPQEADQLDKDCLDEIYRWFPISVVGKLNLLLGFIRDVSNGVIRDFLEVVLSSVIREVSQQDPDDLRIRRRKENITDANVFQSYIEALETQYNRIEKFWSVRGYAPDRFYNCRIVEGDARNEATIKDLGIESGSIDLVLTSPPYATALPYIDTDRLSILVILGMNSTVRRPIERKLIGSREIGTLERSLLEAEIYGKQTVLPTSIRSYLFDLSSRLLETDVGFRRKNMPALLLRFFQDMNLALKNCHTALRTGGKAMIVIGDNRIRIDNEYERIPTTDFMVEIACSNNFELLERIDISVTTENMVHVKNAITKNVVLSLSALPSK